MKVLVKWKWSMALTLLFLMAMTVYITVGSKGEEKSRLGFTLNQRTSVVTHINACDINIVTPKSFMRFFPDSAVREIAFEMKNRDMDFLAVSDDYQYFMEVYVLEEASFSTEEDYERQILNTQGEYSVTDAFIHEDVPGTEMDFHKVSYPRRSGAYQDYGVVTDYFTKKGETVLEIRCCYDAETEPEFDAEIAELDQTFRSSFSDCSFGNPGKAEAENENYLWERFKSLTFAPWVLTVPFLYLLLCNITFTGRAERVYDGKKKGYYYVSDEGTGWNEAFLSRDISKMILGFFAVMIVFHHLTQQVGAVDAGILSVLENFGVGFVGVFFFFSGFGLYESVQKKENYLKGFIKTRLPSVLVPFYSAVAVFVTVRIAYEGPGNPGTLLMYLTGVKLINSHMWYIVEIVFLYLLFYVLFRLIKNRSLALMFLFFFCMALVAFSLTRGHGDAWFQGEWWYNTTLLFPFGIWFGKHKEGITAFLKRFYPICLAAVTVLFFLFYRMTNYMLSSRGYWSENGTDPGYDDKLCCLIVQCPMVLFFVLLVLLIGMKLLIGNRFLRFLGDISLELYLIHNLFIEGFSMIKGAGAFMLSVMAASFVAATILHYVNTCILCLIRKKPVPRPEVKRALEAYGKQTVEGFKTRTNRIRRELSYAKKHRKKTAVRLLRYSFCILLCLLSLFPIGILLINATKTNHGILQGLSFLPGGNFAENYRMAKGVFLHSGNSLFAVVGRSCLISGGCAFIGTYIGGLCAYGFEYYSFKGKKVLWRAVIASLMIPQIAGSVGFLRMVLKLHLYNSLLPLILVGIAIPSCAYFFRMYLHSMSLMSIIEAARIDGCKELMIFNRLILPVMKPAVLLELIFNFAVSWNNTVYQNLVLTDIKKKTIAIFLMNETGGRGSGSDPVVYCLLLLATVPSLIVYLLFSPGIMARINIGSVKE